MKIPLVSRRKKFKKGANGFTHEPFLESPSASHIPIIKLVSSHRCHDDFVVVVVGVVVWWL
jgi:hypothetical protein